MVHVFQRCVAAESTARAPARVVRGMAVQGHASCGHGQTYSTLDEKFTELKADQEDSNLKRDVTSLSHY